MQQVLVFVLWTVVAILMHSVILPDFPSVKIWSDLIFYLIIILALRYSLATGVLVAAVLGYVVDTMSAAPYGTAIISYVLTLILIRNVRANIYFESRLALFFWVGAFSIFRQTIVVLFLLIGHRNISLEVALAGQVFLRALWEAALGIVLLPLLETLLYKDWGLFFRKKKLG